MVANDPIFARASVRKFEKAPLTEEQIEQLLRAAMQAPSAGNQQPWEFFVVTDPEKKTQLSKASPYAGSACAAPAIFVLCGNRRRCRFPENWEMDLSAAAQNILLEAVQIGLGACWMSLAPLPERMEAAAETLGLADDLMPFCLIPVGIPAKPVEVTVRYDASRVHRI